MNELLTKDSERITALLTSLDKIFGNLEQLSQNCRPMLDGERFLTDKEVSDRLRISRRTLQEYRNEGRIPYILLGGKVLYKESDIEKTLWAGYRNAGAKRNRQ